MANGSPWDSEKEVGFVAKTPNTRIRVTLCMKNGKEYIHLHDQYQTNKEPGKWQFGSHGISFETGLKQDVAQLILK